MNGTTIVTVDAKPERLAIDLARIAVLVIDMQNDFGAVGGMFERAGIDISGIRATIGPTSRVLAAARSHKGSDHLHRGSIVTGPFRYWPG